MASNLFNLLIFIILICRIPTYFNLTIPSEISSVRILWILFPLFLINASSSMETVPACWFLLEFVHHLKKKMNNSAVFWLVLAVFTRLEFLIFIFIAIVPFWQTWGKRLLVIFIFWLLYLIWVWGKNPTPFQGINEALIFYLARMGMLIESGGMGMLLLIVPILFLWKSSDTELFILKTIAISNLIFFLIFPFEWEYALPGFAIALVVAGKKLGTTKSLLLGMLIGGFSFIHPSLQQLKNKKIDFRLEWPHETRLEAFHDYQWAQTADFTEKTIFLTGATLYPFPISRWEKVLDNRIFHRRNSNFFVGERLNTKVLDSLKTQGFQIFQKAPQGKIKDAVISEE